MISFEKVSFAYPCGKNIFTDFSAEIPTGGIVAAAAPSGGGKTTFLRLLAGLETPQSGTITGTDGKRFSIVFQEDRLIGHISAEKNIALANSGGDARRWLEAMALSDNAQTPVDELSGGMKRRVAIARALNYGGDILLLDEPLKGMEDALKEKIAALIKDCFPLTVISVHEEKEALLFAADTVIRLPRIG